MSKISKNKKFILKKIDLKKNYSLNKAIYLLKKYSFVKFDESIDLSINLNIDKKKINKISNLILFPYNFSKKKCIAFFGNKFFSEKAKKYGAHIIGKKKIINQIKLNKIKFDIIITMPKFLNNLKCVNKILNLKKIMPSYKLGTLTNDIKNSIKNIKNGQIIYKSDKFGIIHITIGKISFKISYIKKNFLYFINKLKKDIFSNIKKKYFNKITLSSSMGAGINIDINNI